jgi:spore germination protein GerM
VGAGCGIRPDSAPHDVPEEDRALTQRNVASGTEAGGAGRIYLVEPGEGDLLRSVAREAASSEDLMKTLMLGPNRDELEAEYSTAIPSNLQVLSVTEQPPILTVDVTPELTELTGPGLVQALAQIVYTASEIERVDQVQITVNNARIAWPRANSESSADPLRTYDYPGMVNTAQPAYPTVPSGE